MGNWYKWEEELIGKLSQDDSVFADMVARHRSLEKRLDELKGKKYLSSDEEGEERKLKVEKLKIRDKLEETLRSHKHVVVPA